ncbi:MAG: sulfatase [Acidobacteria bacterium]|nr:sulfatase [Acidobacteriota bacterium]
MKNVTRRSFVQSAALPFVLRGAGAERPNILYIMCDDHAAQAIGAYGGRINRTPNIDRIANGGMRFDNCYCTNSLCTPSRAVILTGKYSHLNGICTLDNRFSPTQETFSTPLQRAGYHTGLVGKWHVANNATGFDFWSILPGQGKYFDPDFIQMGAMIQKKGYCTDVITDMALEFLQKRPKDKPFCLLLQHKAPHDPWSYDEKHAHLYENEDIPEPATLYDDYKTRGNAIRQAECKIGLRHTLYQQETGNLPPEKRKPRQYQIFIKSYLRCVASVDDNVGRVLDYLDASGLANNTVVVYTSDQGVFLGEHGLYDKRFMYEDSLRMPLLVRYPREVKPGSVNRDMVLNLDFAETLLDYGGASAPADMQGRSFRPLLKGQAPRDWRTSMYYRYWMHGAHFNIPAHLGVRTKRYKLVYYYGQTCGKKGTVGPATAPEWEFFDLKEDPLEMHNVYGVPAFASVVRELTAELKRLQKEYKDTGPCGAV